MDERRLSVLLVEDDEDDYVILRDLLGEVERWHFDVEWCKSYEQALQKILVAKHEIYLTDYRLGAHTGLDFLRKLKASGSQAPLIMLTGDGTQDVDEEAMRAGAADYLVKGKIDASLLERSIRHALERMRLEAAMRQSEKLSAVGQLAAGVAHEINNPLGVILGFAQALIRRLPSGDANEPALKSIERESLRCKRLVENLLTFSRTGHETQETAQLNGIVEGALSLVEAEAKVAKINVIRDLAEAMPLILGNANQLQQVVINLANNAIDAMVENGTVTLKTFVADKQHQSWVCLSVNDTGQGVPSAVQSRIFEPFFTTKPVGKGTGLGLSLVYEIIQKHKGKIELDSRPGHTTFTVYLPIANSTPVV